MSQINCPKCNGLLVKDRDAPNDQWVAVCILCGYRRDAIKVATGLVAETGARTLQGKSLK